VLLYIHGGAFVLRFPNLHAALAGRWCRRLGSRALLVDYRLAPEHPYPAALDDCVRAYRWLLEQNTDPGRIVIAGDSAGGNLVLATLHRLKAGGDPLPRCAVLLSPVVDFTLSSPSLFSNAARDPMFTFEKLAALRLFYAAPEQFLEPTVSPLFGDFTGFPPLLFHAGEIEMLRDESTRAAERAHAAGVTVEVEVWRDMHVFHALPLPQARPAEERIARFVERHAGWTSAS
jgi:acetyl esterase/lipase